jgi:peroxiredoxin
MVSHSKTLRMGDPAPDFTLPAANGSAQALSEALRHGPVVLEFLRGTW